MKYVDLRKGNDMLEDEVNIYQHQSQLHPLINLVYVWHTSASTCCLYSVIFSDQYL